MKTSALVVAAFLALTPALMSSARATGQCAAARCGFSGTGTVFEIGQSYANGGGFAGTTSGTTGTALDIARASLSFPGSVDRIASNWKPGPIMAKGE